MKIATFDFLNRTCKELRFDSDNLKSIEWAEKQKTRLENLGYTLKFTDCGLFSTTMGYVLYKRLKA